MGLQMGKGGRGLLRNSLYAPGLLGLLRAAASGHPIQHTGQSAQGRGRGRPDGGKTRVVCRRAVNRSSRTSG